MSRVKLKDITISITDGKHGDCKGHNNSGYFFVSCKDVFDGVIHYENSRQITKEDFVDADRRTNLMPNDILITNSGTIGRMALVKDIPETRKTTFQKSVAIVKPDSEKVLPVYLYYLLQSKVNDFINSSNGAAQKNLLLSTMRDFDLEIEDSLPTQHRIATILSRYDSLIENYQKQIKLLEEAAQRLYKEWFVDLRFPGHENTKIVDDVPEEWKKKRLGEIFKTTSGGTPSRRKGDFYNGDILWVKTKELNDCFIFNTEENITEEAILKSSAKIIPRGSILLAMYGATIGKIGIAAKEMSCNQACCVFLLSEEDVTRWFLYNWLLSNREFLISQGKGVAQPNLSQDIIKKFELIFPSLSLLKEFDLIAKPIYSKSAYHQNQVRLLTEARDRLLPKLMSGEINTNNIIL